MHSDAVKEIHVISRSKNSHPSSKVKVVKGDLTDPSCLRDLDNDFDCVIHIAGLYDFSSSYSDNYLNNVVATSQLLAWAKEQEKAPHFHFISTYAVGAGRWDFHEPEEPLKNLPPEDRFYPYSKALAEESVIKSTLPYTIYRPGIIVGDTEKGHFENLNGPYYIISLLSQLNKVRLLPKLPVLPLPAVREAFLPLVPVDSVAKAIVAGVMDYKKSDGKIYGLYRSGELTCENFFNQVISHFNLKCKPLFVGIGHKKVLELQKYITDIPEEVFLYANEVPNLVNSQFGKDFPDLEMPRFDEYAEAFFSGYQAMNGDF
jgi:nucleoside-diphosphate-sugar epimerase